MSNCKWNNIGIIFLKEIFDRNVRWIIKKDRDIENRWLSSSYNTIDYNLIKKTFEYSKTSYRIVMFQVYFLNNIGCPPNTNPPSILASYNKSLGRPSKEKQLSLQQACKKILSISTYSEFFRFLNVPTPSDNYLMKLLKDAVINSSRKGYHQTRRSQNNFSRQNWRRR